MSLHWEKSAFHWLDIIQRILCHYGKGRSDVYKAFGRQSDVVKIHNKVITMYDLQDIFLSLPTDVVGDFGR